MSRPRPRTIVAAGAALATFAAPAVASAATGHHAARHTHRVSARVHGLVVARHGERLTVLAHSLQVGGRTVHRRVVTVTLTRTAAHHAARAVRAGDVVTARGESDSGAISGATVASSVPTPASVVYGTVAAVEGTLVTVDVQDSADGAHSGPDGGNSQGGDGQGDDNQSGDSQGSDGPTADDTQGQPLVADVTVASFSGAATAAADLSTGEYVVMLGEQAYGGFAAVDVVAYAAAPAFVVGPVTAADQGSNTLTIAAEDGDNSEDANAAGTTVDASNALVVVNGAQGGYPAAGDQALVVGPDGSAGTTTTSGATVAASIVFDFTSGDDQPVEDNSGALSGD